MQIEILRITFLRTSIKHKSDIYTFALNKEVRDESDLIADKLLDAQRKLHLIASQA